MKLNDAFPSKYLKAEDMEEGDLVLTIKDAQFEEFTDPKTRRPDNKPVLYFEGKDSKPLVLNKTNFKAIAQALGSDDSEDWIGKKVALYATEVESFGEMTMGIRIRLKAPGKAMAAVANGDAPVPADGSTEFWKAAKQRGLDNAAALPAAKQAMSGAVSWKDAIELLPEGKKAATVDADEIPFN